MSTRDRSGLSSTEDGATASRDAGAPGLSGMPIVAWLMSGLSSATSDDRMMRAQSHRHGQEYQNMVIR